MKHINKFLKYWQNKSLRFALTLLLISAFLYGWKLSVRSLYEDEYQVFDAAYTFQREGNFYKWDWIADTSGENTDCLNQDKFCNYTRALPHTVLVGLSMKIFGASEWSARIISVLFGIITIQSMYWITRELFKSNSYAFLTAVVILLHIEFVELFRYSRMYALLIPLYVLTVYLSAKIIEKVIQSKKVSKVEIGTLSAGMILLPIIHLNSLLIIPSLTILLILALYTFKRSTLNIYATVSGILLLILGGVSAYMLIPTIHKQVSLFGTRNYQYLGYIFEYPLGIVIGCGVFLIGLYYSWGDFKKKEFLIPLMYINILFALIFFIFVADRYAAFQYISHIAPLVIIILSYMIFQLNKKFRFAKIGYIFLVLVIIIQGLQFWENREVIYGNEHKYGQIKEAYQVIKDGIYLNDKVLGLFIRDYYLNDIKVSPSQIQNIPRSQQFRLEELQEVESTNETVWLVWERSKQHHIDQKVLEYVINNYEKLTGENIDETKVEIFRSK